MLIKKTSRNQITLPKEVVQKFPGIDCFEVSVRGEKIELRPVKVRRDGVSLEKTRKKIAELGLTERNVKKAVQWARRKGKVSN
ncbi:MAG: hypothetical protein LLH30_00370 [Candidatus Manganitrophus sp. SA1]|nr:hypothetical protein [Candidatus Manganitrophus morganii]